MNPKKTTALSRTQKVCILATPLLALPVKRRMWIVDREYRGLWVVGRGVCEAAAAAAGRRAWCVLGDDEGRGGLFQSVPAGRDESIIHGPTHLNPKLEPLLLLPPRSLPACRSALSGWVWMGRTHRSMRC